MAELLFILTTVYVAYVVYKVGDDKKTEKRATAPNTVPTILTSASVTEPAKGTESTQTPAETAPEEETAAPQPAVETAVLSSSNLRDPDSGETAKVTNNYRSLKRWLKEALVKEGLLEKVYHNNELNDETNAKIKEALEKIKVMPKYHG